MKGMGEWPTIATPEALAWEFGQTAPDRQRLTPCGAHATIALNLLPPERKEHRPLARRCRRLNLKLCAFTGGE
jgi:hypothetical protein